MFFHFIHIPHSGVLTFPNPISFGTHAIIKAMAVPVAILIK
jgi:hypothetical protein